MSSIKPPMHTHEQDDQATWAKFKDGDHSVFKKIYEDHIEALLQYGMRFSLESARVEDEIHNLFVYLWQHRSNLGTTDNIRCYLLVALRRRLVRNLKREQLTGPLTPDKSEDGFTLHAEARIVADEQHEENHQLLKQALQQLSDRQREAVFLKYEKGLSYDEICTIMDINYQSVRNLVATAIKSLRGIMTTILGFLAILWTL